MIYCYAILTIRNTLELLHQEKCISTNNAILNHRMDGAYFFQNLDKGDPLNNRHSYHGSICKVEDIHDRYPKKHQKRI